MSEKRQANIVVKHIKSEYGANPEFLWPDRYPGYAVFNLKFDKNQTYDFAETSDHIFPAYHMNKNNWITIWLDGTLPNGLIFELIKKSYLLSAK